MTLNHDVVKALSYLRKRYKVSERDLMGLAKKFNSGTEPEESWEEITVRYLRDRQGRFARKRRYHR